MDDETESQDVESDDNWEQEVKDHRRRLFQQEVEEPQIPHHQAPDDESDLDAFKQEVNSDMDEWATSVMQRRREADERILPPAPPKIESDFSAFPSVPFRKTDTQEKQAAMLLSSAEGDFEGDADFVSDPSFDVVVDNPFAFTIKWVEWSAETDVGRVYTGWGPQGGSENFITFVEGDGIDGGGFPFVNLPAVNGTPPNANRYHCSQAVPALGFVQFQYPDPPTPVSFHYKIHYTKSGPTFIEYDQ